MPKTQLSITREIIEKEKLVQTHRTDLLASFVNRRRIHHRRSSRSFLVICQFVDDGYRLGSCPGLRSLPVLARLQAIVGCGRSWCRDFRCRWTCQRWGRRIWRLILQFHWGLNLFEKVYLLVQMLFELCWERRRVVHAAAVELGSWQ